MAQPYQVAFDAYGVPVTIGVPAEDLLAHIRRVLPPGSVTRDDDDREQQFALRTTNGGSYLVEYGTSWISGSSDLVVALEVLASQLRAYVALRAPGLIFVHAGVVARGSRALVVPGVSFSGKSTLVAELVRAGATYYSDEYAVLGEDGLVRPFAKPLSLRTGLADQVDHPVETFGATAGEDPVAVGLVVAARYRPGASWDPRRGTAGDCALALMANTVPAQERPAEALRTVRRAVEGAVLLEGERGEASAITAALLAELDG